MQRAMHGVPALGEMQEQPSHTLMLTDANSSFKLTLLPRSRERAGTNPAFHSTVFLVLLFRANLALPGQCCLQAMAVTFASWLCQAW